MRDFAWIPGGFSAVNLFAGRTTYLDVKTVLVISFAVLLASCNRYGPQHPNILLATKPSSAFAPDVPLDRNASVAAAVVDQRPYVLEGKRSKNFEGIRRNSFTVVYPKETPTNQPLATYIEDAVVYGLQHKSLNADRLPYLEPGTPEANVTTQCVQAGKDLCVVLILNEWQYEMFHSKVLFRYSAHIRIVDRTGKALAEKDFSASVPLENVLVLTYLNTLQAEYKKALEQMFNDPVIANALRRS